MKHKDINDLVNEIERNEEISDFAPLLDDLDDFSLPLDEREKKGLKDLHDTFGDALEPL